MLGDLRLAFAAKRRGEQDELIERLLSSVQKSIASDDYNDLLDVVRDEYRAAFAREHGKKITLLSGLLTQIRAMLNKIDEPGPTTARSTATAIAVALLNYSTMDAADDDDEPLLLEWVTMHDADVRPSHRDADGQQRPAGERFLVGESKMRAPGDMSAPISEWINCRCSLAPTSALVASTVDAPTEEKTMDDEAIAMPDVMEWHGVLAPEGVWSGDRRKFAEGSLSARNLPLPFKWQKVNAEGHDGDVVIGSIDKIEMRENLMHASGRFLQTPEADEFIGLVSHFGQYGVSIEADEAEFSFEEDEKGGMPWTTFSLARVTTASAVPVPAYQEAYIMLGSEEAALAAGRGPGWLTNPEDTKRLHDYWTKPGHEGYEKISWGVPGDFNRCRTLVGEKIATNSPEDTRFLNQICAQWHHDALGFWPGRAPTEQSIETPEGQTAEAVTLVAARGIIAPSAYFANPNLTKPTKLTITDEGRIYAHVAQWGVCHVGFEGVCVEPPDTYTDYQVAMNGDVLTDAGLLPVGHITMGGGHAPSDLSRTKALAYYDSTSTVVADVTFGNDDIGIWCAGWIRPGTTPEQVVALRASSLSGDWRRVHGNLELILAHAVNSPGFPISRVASGAQISLVAAGVVQPTDDTPDVYDRLADDLAEQVAAALVRREERKVKMAALATKFRGEE